MDPNPTLIELDHERSSLSILGGIVALGIFAYVLNSLGTLGWMIDAISRGIRWMIRRGFQAWEATLSWASWRVLLLVSVAVITIGVVAAGLAPWITLACAAVVIFMGLTACLAYMFIDIERYEVERGYKAVHNPLKGQELAPHLGRHGEQADVLLLLAATVAVVGGFALLNFGFYASFARHWYQVHDEGVGYVDFLTYAFLNLLRVVDIFDLLSSRHLLRVSLVRPALWPASMLILVFRTFFTLVLLQQIFASIRQGRLLAETITDLWSPHEPIQQRARNALPQYGAAAIEPLLISLRGVKALTKEQREQFPVVLAAIGPSSTAALTRHLSDAHEHVRAVSAATLGRLNAQDALPSVVALADDPSDHVRQCLAEGLGLIAEAAARNQEGRSDRRQHRGLRRWFSRGARTPVVSDPAGATVAALRKLLADPIAAVRCQAATSLGMAGEAGRAAIADLALRLGDADETVRCQSAEALGRVGTEDETALRALTDALKDPAAEVRAAVACGLGLMGKSARPAAPHLVPLLQDRDEVIRSAAAEAMSRIGPIDETATAQLVEGLTSPDNVVRAQTAEALGAIEAPAEETAEALTGVLRDSNDVVRAKAAEALGKIGEAAADVAVPQLVKALRDRDSWVSALAAEALGEMGEAADSAIPALTKALGHVNPRVRANAAGALGKLGGAERARGVLERAAGDADGAVRAAAVRALALLGATTPGTLRLILDALRDADPLVRAAGADALGETDVPAEEIESLLLPLLADANDEVKMQVTKVLTRHVGAVPSVVEGLCRVLTDDDSALVQVNAAIGLARLGASAAAAGPYLLRAAQTGDASVRAQAVKALVMVQPAEAKEAFMLGLKDPSGDVRLVASAGWMKAEAVPADAVDSLVAALRDAEVQVRANAARALSRLDALPAGAVPVLIQCVGEGGDTLRLNAALALRKAPPATVQAALEQLLEDANGRIRLVAAETVLAANRFHVAARGVVEAARTDPSPRVRQAAQELWQSLPETQAEAEPAAAVESGEELSVVSGPT